MVRFVKVILFLLFAVSLHVIVDNFFTLNDVDKKVYTVATEGEFEEHGNIGAPQLPYWPEAEIVTGLQTQQVSISRIQRMHITEYFLSLKNMVQRVADREASLSQHLGKIYATTTSYFCNPASDYYVFALRHIII